MKPITDVNELFRHQRAIRNFTAAEVSEMTPLSSPQASAVLGQHTDAVLRAHGYTPEEITELRTHGVIH